MHDCRPNELEIRRCSNPKQAEGYPVGVHRGATTQPPVRHVNQVGGQTMRHVDVGACVILNLNSKRRISMWSKRRT